LTSVDPSNASGSSFLAESLTNPNEQVRLAAAAGLVELHIADTGTAAALRPLLRSEDKQTAVTAARLLAVVNPNEQAALDFLSNALREEDGQVSFAAAKALAYMGVANPTSLQILISCLQNPALGWGTQRQSALALGKLGPAARSALPALGKLLTGSREPPLRQAAAAAIKQIRGERSVSYGEEDSAPALFDELVTGGGMRGLMGLR